MLMLQRRLLHDCARWRTVMRFQPAVLDEVARLAKRLHELAAETSDWRVVTNEPPHSVIARMFAGDPGWALNEPHTAPG